MWKLAGIENGRSQERRLASSFLLTIAGFSRHPVTMNFCHVFFFFIYLLVSFILSFFFFFFSETLTPGPDMLKTIGLSV